MDGDRLGCFSCANCFLVVDLEQRKENCITYVTWKRSSRNGEQEAAIVKEKLESQAKEAQDYVGGGHDKGTVVATQVVVPSKVGEKADEVIDFTVE